VILALFITNLPITTPVVIGILMLIGIVTKNAITPTSLMCGRSTPVTPGSSAPAPRRSVYGVRYRQAAIVP